MGSLCHPLILLIDEAGTVVCFSLEAAQNKNPKKSRILNQDEDLIFYLVSVLWRLTISMIRTRMQIVNILYSYTY